MELGKVHDSIPPMDWRLAEVVTPLILSAWKQKLERHPDKEYASYILRGIEQGFHIGVEETRVFLSAKKNMQSASQNPQVIEEYIRKEVEKGNIAGPFTSDVAPKVHVNRIGAIPKKYQTNKWRVITDLSYPEGQSVNDTIDPQYCSLAYITVDQVANTALSLGRGALIAKTDIKAAYRLIPVHPIDRKWLGMKWEGKIYIDRMLPFGLRSAPKVFNSVADAVEWCVAREGVDYVFHYLDDFAVVGPPDSPACLHHLLTLKGVCASLGIPLADEKECGPCTEIILLGIVIDTIKGELRLPDDKLQRLLYTTAEWGSRKSCTRRELESLIGVLHHASKVIQPGRSFLRRAINLLSVAKRHHHIRLNTEFRADMLWWQTFAVGWNGASLLVNSNSREVSVTSDASGSWGCGAWQGNKWFQLQWDANSQSLHISAKELIPILIAAVVWGEAWQGCRIKAHCDNSAVVAVINSRYCKDHTLMHLLRCLFFIEAKRQFKLVAVHVPGRHNSLADDLSRNRLADFLTKKSDAELSPTTIPISLLQWLLHPGLDWISPVWMRQFATFMSKV